MNESAERGAVAGAPQVRALTGQDTLEWLRLRRTFWSEGDEALHRAEIVDILQDPSRQSAYGVVRADGRLGGFAEASLRAPLDRSPHEHCAYLEGWYVEPDLRGQGFGRRLIEQVEDWARGLGFQRLASDSLLANEAGHRAHAAVGFRETSRIVTFVKELGSGPPRS